MSDDMGKNDHFPWMVSDYLDCDHYGMLNNRGQIVIGFGAGLSKDQLEVIAAVVNKIGEAPETPPDLLQWARVKYDADGPADAKPYWKAIIRMLEETCR